MSNATAQKKITAATFKAFVRKNRANLHVMVAREFDGMVDGSVEGSKVFRPAQPSELSETHTCGVRGVWLVGRSRDWFQPFNKDGFTGIEVSNCCGNYVVAIPTA